MDVLLAMKIFITVAEKGSFVGAAKQLSVTTSAASRRVAQLEHHLGVRLLNRTTRRLSLTEGGRGFYERSTQILADVSEAQHIASAGASAAKGTIKLTCPINFGLSDVAPAIGAFLTDHPQVKFDVSLSDSQVNLVDEGYDLAIRIGELRNQHLIARKLGTTRIVICASPAYLARRGTPLRPDDLTKHDCLSYEYLPSKREWPFSTNAGTTRSVRFTGSVHANNAGILVEIAARGAGIARAPDFIVESHIAAGRLVPILGEFAPPASSIYAVYPSRRQLSAKVRVFVDFLIQHFGRRNSPSIT